MEQAEEVKAKAASRDAKGPVVALLFCVICIAVNFIGSGIASALGSPLYLDSIGSILAGVLGGYMPGVMAGYITNMVTSAIDPSSIYYCISSILIAVAAANFAQRGWFKKLPTVLLAVVVFALIGGALGSFITWCLYGSGNALSSPFAQGFHDLGFSLFWSQICSDFVLDLIDKGISVAIAVVAIRLLPGELIGAFDLALWRQKPLEGEQLTAAHHAKTRSLSFRAKIAIVVAVIMIIVAIATTGISYMMYHRSNIEAQGKMAMGVANLVAERVDADKIDDYLAVGEDAPGYKEIEREIVEIRESSQDVRYVYVYKIQEDGCHVVIDPDTEEEPGNAPGTVLDFDEAFMPYLDDLLAGKTIEPIVSNEDYGWLLTAYRPLYDSHGSCAAYAAVDISMDSLLGEEYNFLVRVIILFGAFFVLICAVAIWLAEYNVIMPINSIALASAGFAFDSESTRGESVEALRNLNIRTGDEVENLYSAVLRTSEDTVQFIADAHEKADTIQRMQDNLIMVMADLVESRDQYTGDHVRKTAAYALICMEQMMIDGIYVDQLTPDFVSDVYHSAPLHDIGKIAVTDAVLNKPGRLTDDEFEMMKQHTTAGREILERAVGAVSEETYLDEARNLAEYHHEKWNGQGYPRGLAGEEIPLSARIMAVADVFDALVSKRSYKDGFPLDKAFAIIEEGKGTHFDPLIAQAFLDAREEVERVVRFYGDGQTDKEPQAEEGSGEGRPSEEPKAGE